MNLEIQFVEDLIVGNSVGGIAEFDNGLRGIISGEIMAGQIRAVQIAIQRLSANGHSSSTHWAWVRKPASLAI